MDVHKGKLGWNFLSLLFEAVFYRDDVVDGLE